MLQWLEIWIQFSHSSQFTNQHCFLSCTDQTHQKSQHSMNSVIVGCCLMVSLSMLRYHVTSWIFHEFSGLSILVFRYSWVRLIFSACNMFMSLKSDPSVISLMTHLNVSATLHIVTTMIGSRADVSAWCPCGGVVCISERWQGTEFYLYNGYHSRSSPINPGKSFCAWLIDSSRVFPHKIDSGNPITTFSVSNLHIIAAAAEVKVLPRPILSATIAPDISESQTHLLTINHMTQTWCARNFIPRRPGTGYF